MMQEGAPLLQIEGLKTYFYAIEGLARAVDGVDLMVDQGEIVGIVGESGCGKSVTALSILRLIQDPPGRIVGGRILFEGKDLLSLSDDEMREIRGNKISMIFQEPMTSLNPLLTVGNQIAESIMLHQNMGKREAKQRAIEALRDVQIPSPEQCVDQYPHQLSGGMRQRAMIAMALACNPKLLIADEPTTALDVTIQAQIIDLILQLQERTGMAILLISHNLGLIAEVTQRVLVMYTGKVVEVGPVEAIFDSPAHPYTRGLLDSIPLIGEKEKGRSRTLREIPGLVPSLFRLPEGCPFHPRCSEVKEICRREPPSMFTVQEGHMVSCWLMA